MPEQTAWAQMEALAMSPQPLQSSGIGWSMPPAEDMDESVTINAVMVPACAADNTAPSASARTRNRLQRRRTTGMPDHMAEREQKINEHAAIITVSHNAAQWQSTARDAGLGSGTNHRMVALAPCSPGCCSKAHSKAKTQL